jgi:multiple sugar transport system permease protein
MAATERAADITSAPAPPLVRGGRGWPRPTVGARRALFLVVLSSLSLIFVYPFVWAVSASLKPTDQVFDNRLIPREFAWENYTKVWDAAKLFTWLLNIAYFRFPGRTPLFGLVLATMMLPFAVTMIPVFLIWDKLGLVNTQFPLWAQNLFGSAFYIFLLRQFFLGIPRDLFEAARVDGDNFFTMFWRIAMPLAKPALVVAFIFELQASWNDLLKPLIYLQDPNLYTIPLGLKTILDGFGQGGEQQWEIVVAATVITTIPMILIFFLGQRYFVEGIATSGRKG